MTVPLSTSLPWPVTVLPSQWSLADLHRHLGGVPLERVRLYPPPGMATETDVLRLQEKGDLHCELIDGILVEKPMGYYESRVAAVIIAYLQQFLDSHDLGIVLGEGGVMRILTNQVRMPDVCFIGWDHFPQHQLPREPIPDLFPDLAIEVLSASNTPQEMDRKLSDYFAAGVKLVWYIDPDARSATVYRSGEKPATVAEEGILDGGDVLPGFQLPLRDLFAKAGRRA